MGRLCKISFHQRRIPLCR